MKTNKQQSKSAAEINNVLRELHKKAEEDLKQKKMDPLKWFLEQVIQKQYKAPRLLLLKQSLQSLRQYVSDVKLLNSLFIDEGGITSIVMQSNNLIDMAFALSIHLEMKILQKKIQYASVIMDTLHQKICMFLDQQKGNINGLLRLTKVTQFLDFKQQKPSQIYENIDPEQLQNLRQQVFILYKYIVKPWLEKKTPKNYYQQLTIIVYWMIIIEDDTPQKQLIMIDLTKKLDKYFCGDKGGDGQFNYFKLYSLIMDILSINYRKEDPFKIYCLAPLLNAFEHETNNQLVNNWLESRGKNLKPTQIENIFRNSYQIGSTIFVFNIIDSFSKTLKAKTQYNLLYHLFLSYFKKDYLDIELPNQTFLNKYYDILEFYVIGFINRDRLDGQSQLDRLTANMSGLLLRTKFNFRKSHERIINFYKMYEARFSFLSFDSKKFMEDMQKLYRYYPQLTLIHNKIHEKAFRDAGLEDDPYGGFQQLNVKRTDRYRGMMNLGNTCYMNAFMQALFMTKKFRSTIIDIRDEKNLSSKKTMAYALINLFTEMSTKTISVDSEIIPDIFKNQTPEPFKSSWEQHDVAEFGRIYFDTLANQLSDDRNKNRIERIFFNKVDKKLICRNCNNEKVNSQLVLDFILHLNKKDNQIFVSKLLSDYFLGEELNGDNKVFCEKCKRKTQVLAIPHPVKLAEYLIITIGLFEYSGGGKKIKKPFNFEFTINFSKIITTESNNMDQNYQLYAFIVHIGNESERGHYICYARNIEQNPTIWYCFDDSYVTQRQIQNVSEFQFGESQTPYLLFYCASKKRKSLNSLNSLNSSNLGRKNTKEYF